MNRLLARRWAGPGVMGSRSTGRRVGWLLLVAGVGLAVGCGSESVPEPIRVAYQYRMDPIRDSSPTVIPAGHYRLRYAGDCLAAELLLTHGRIFEKEYRIEDHFVDDLDLNDDTELWIRQRTDVDMPGCEGVVFYPSGSDDLPAKPSDADLGAVAASRVNQPVSVPALTELWARQHLKSIAQVHGIATGVVNGAGTMLAMPGQAELVCISAAAEFDLSGRVAEAIASYPGTTTIREGINGLLGETSALFDRCADDVSALLHVEAWSEADAALSLAVFDVITEIGFPLDPESGIVADYDLIREQEREAARSNILAISIPGGDN